MLRCHAKECIHGRIGTDKRGAFPDDARSWPGTGLLGRRDAPSGSGGTVRPHAKSGDVDRAGCAGLLRHVRFRSAARHSLRTEMLQRRDAARGARHRESPPSSAASRKTLHPVTVFLMPSRLAAARSADPCRLAVPFARESAIRSAELSPPTFCILLGELSPSRVRIVTAADARFPPDTVERR